MSRASITIRIYWKDFRKLRHHFKAKRGETVASYVERLADWVAETHAYMYK